MVVLNIAKKYGVSYSHFRRWVYAYEANGVEGFTKVTRTHDDAIKIHIIEYMHTNSLSVNQAAAIFGIKSPSTIARWERLYYEESKKALLEERRGRKHMSTKTPNETKKKNVNENEDLLAEF